MVYKSWKTNLLISVDKNRWKMCHILHNRRSLGLLCLLMMAKRRFVRTIPSCTTTLINLLISKYTSKSAEMLSFLFIFTQTKIKIETYMLAKLNNPIWVMSSAYDKLSLDELIATSKEVGAQGIDLCVFRKDGTREDHTATHLEYEGFSAEDGKRLIEKFNAAELSLSLGAFENMIGGDPEQRVKNQNHLLRLIRIAHLLGGDRNDVK